MYHRKILLGDGFSKFERIKRVGTIQYWFILYRLRIVSIIETISCLEVAMAKMRKSATKTDGRRSGKTRPWSKGDHRELKRHSKARTSRISYFTSNETYRWRPSATSFETRHRFGTPALAADCWTTELQGMTRRRRLKGVKQEPPIERSGALRDAPIWITYWGDFLPGRAAYCSRCVGITSLFVV